MIFLVHTSTPDGDLPSQLGRPEYSYRFVVKEFLPMLQSLGKVIEVRDPEREVDVIHEQCRQRGEDCVFLCFMPPNKVPLNLACPTIPVFAWEYETLPNEAFGDKSRNDWTRVLSWLGCGLTHSSYTVERVRAQLGGGFPIASVPAPLWDRMQPLRGPATGPVVLDVDGMVIDSRVVDLSAYRLSNIKAALPGVLPLPEKARHGVQKLLLDGVVYTAVFNPYDGRKNWLPMVSAFCEAMRNRTDATLLLKLTHHDPADLIPDMIEGIYKMGPVKCRIILLHGFLPPPAYENLLRASTYAVNASHGEGQCLPLMEYMSAGKPAVAPRHTSMLDYIDTDCAFVIDSSAEIGCWPHDPRQIFRTLRQRIHVQSLVSAFRRSYYVAVNEPNVYAGMSAAAVESLRRYCSMDVVKPRFLDSIRARLLAVRSETQGVAGSHGR